MWCPSDRLCAKVKSGLRKRKDGSHRNGHDWTQPRSTVIAHLVAVAQQLTLLCRWHVVHVHADEMEYAWCVPRELQLLSYGYRGEKWPLIVVAFNRVGYGEIHPSFSSNHPSGTSARNLSPGHHTSCRPVQDLECRAVQPSALQQVTSLDFLVTAGLPQVQYNIIMYSFTSNLISDLFIHVAEVKQQRAAHLQYPLPQSTTSKTSFIWL